MPNEWHTPPEIAKLLRVKPAKVLAWIASGELRAVNTGDAGRPRWRVSTSAWDEFLQGRSSIPAVTVRASRRRRSQDQNVIQFFK